MVNAWSLHWKWGDRWNNFPQLAVFADLPMQQNNSNTHLRFQGYQVYWFPPHPPSHFALFVIHESRPCRPLPPLFCVSSTERRGKRGKDRGAAVSFSLLLTDAWWRWGPREGQFWDGGVHTLLWPLDQHINKQNLYTVQSGHKDSSFFFFCLNLITLPSSEAGLCLEILSRLCISPASYL